MLISKTCSYGVRAALYLAYQEPDQFVPIREISGKLNISFHFLTKILQILTARNILVSFRGPNGGISLARPAREITLYEIIEAIDGPAIFEACILGLDSCDDEHPCPIHEHWKTAREDCKAFFTSSTLQTLVEGAEKEGLRLTDILANSRSEGT